LGQVSRFDERLAQVERLAERLARLDERLVGLERRFEAAAGAKTFIRDEQGRIVGLVSEPGVTCRQLVRNQ
jgi:hypothetical protein